VVDERRSRKNGQSSRGDFSIGYFAWCAQKNPRKHELWLGYFLDGQSFRWLWLEMAEKEWGMSLLRNDYRSLAQS
jgi:hypothetical protein